MLQLIEIGSLVSPLDQREEVTDRFVIVESKTTTSVGGNMAPASGHLPTG